jgi:hypothetical protein
MFKLKPAFTSCLHPIYHRPSIFLCFFADPFMYTYIILVPKLSKWMFMTFSDCVNFFPLISQVIKEHT